MQSLSSKFAVQHCSYLYSSLNPFCYTAVDDRNCEKKLHLFLNKFISKADFYDQSGLCPEEKKCNPHYSGSVCSNLSTNHSKNEISLQTCLSWLTIYSSHVKSHWTNVTTESQTWFLVENTSLDAKEGFPLIILQVSNEANWETNLLNITVVHEISKWTHFLSSKHVINFSTLLKDKISPAFYCSFQLLRFKWIVQDHTQNVQQTAGVWMPFSKSMETLTYRLRNLSVKMTAVLWLNKEFTSCAVNSSHTSSQIYFLPACLLPNLKSRYTLGSSGINLVTHKIIIMPASTLPHYHSTMTINLQSFVFPSSTFIVLVKLFV